MIENMSFHALHRDEYFTFGKRVKEIFTGYELEPLNLKHPYDRVVAALTNLDEAMIKNSTAALTTEVVNKDIRRDDGFVALRNYLRACEKRLKPEWQKAARLVLNEIRVYGVNLHKESYSAESARLNNLLSDFENKPELKAAITLLLLTEWVAELKQAQAEFETAEKARIDAKASTSEIKTDEACLELRKTLEFLFQFMELNYQMTPSEEYKQIMRKINEVIAEFMSAIKARKTRNEKEEEENVEA
ncbi:DUF6261 family protein [Marinifilum flexuosum]|uniref:DUF6261 family protein n=1 Tax=Marinifilum flexuosum TaxID=1117708 RepID=UPI002490BC29|nr:DUF6261 family protein [Marinifilum flexuosum]